MKIRHLVEPSATCDTRAHVVPRSSAVASGTPSTPIDAELRSAAAEMLGADASTIVVVDGDSQVAVITVQDLLRGALADDDQQLCNDLGEHMIRLAGSTRS